MNILYHIIRIILSVGTILILIRNEDIYQAHKHTHPTNKIRYIISQLLTLIIYTIALITLPHISRYPVFIPGTSTHPNTKNKQIILTLTKVHNIIPIPSITNIPSTNIIIL